MCLVPKHFDEKTTTRDILVYKIIQKNNKSLFQDFQYEPNTLYHLGTKLIRIPGTFPGRINEGFHAYRGKKFVGSRLAKCVEFIIPKGAKYYLGFDNEIVSDLIKSGSLTPIKYLNLY